MTPMKTQLIRLLGNTLTYGTGRVLMLMIGMLLLPLFTAYLTPAEYGISSMLSLIVFVITPVFGLGLGAVIGVFYYRSNDVDHHSMVIWTAFAILFASALLLTGGGIWFGQEISAIAFQSTAHARLVVLSLTGAACSIMVTPFMMFFQFENRARSYVLITTASAAMGITAALVLVIALRRGVRGLVEGSLLGQLATLLLFVLPCARMLRPRFNWKTAREMLRVGGAFIPSFLWLFIIQHGNKYILERVDGIENLGIYTIGFNIGMAIAIVVGGFQSAWMPYFMSFVERREEGERVFGRVTTYYVFAFGLLALVFFAAARPAMLVLTRPAFHGAYVVVGCAATAQIFSGLFSVLLPAMYFENDVHYVSVVQAIVAVAAVGLNFALIVWFGVFGAAVGLAIGSLCLPVAQHIWNVRHRAYIHPHYEWRRIGWFALLFTILASAFMSVRNWSLAAELAVGVFGMLVAAGGTFALLTSAERSAFMPLFREAATAFRTRRAKSRAFQSEL